ncbi:MAG: hypothetical protein M3443_19745, partial [Actinomycetota bacterium]|nr:hypothetical protein [Actinomycetota bacterium]
MARLIARHLGVDGIPLAVYPGVILTDSPAVFERKVAEEVVPALIDGLLDSRGSTVLDEAAEDEHAPTEVVLTGSYDEILDSFTERGWTDGLPIVPPTIERVESFLRYTDRSQDEVLGTLLPASRAATVWNVAVNGVMAGCRPEHLPILLAVVEAVADPIFRIEDAGSTPGWEPMVILSGPLADELGFNSAAGALRVGNRANTSIGRFLRLYMRNVAGLRPQPDQTDKGAISYTFNVALSENESAVQEIGWQPYRLDRGFEPTENVVTVRSVVTISAPIYTAGEHPEDHLETIARLMADAIGP